MFADRSDSSNGGASCGITNELLTAMDDSKGVFTLVATNHPWKIDSAFRRRLEKRIYVGLPSDKEKIALIEMSLKDKDHALHRCDFQVMAEWMTNYSCHDITQIISTAQNNAFNKTKAWSHFKLSTCEERKIWMACHPDDKNACQITVCEIIDAKEQYMILKIDLDDVRHAIKEHKSTVHKKHLEELKEFNDTFGMST